MKKSMVITAVVASVTLLAGMSAVAAQPIEISSIEDLQRIGYEAGYPLDGYYVLTQDIDATHTVDWDDDAGFLPIGRGYWDDDILSFSGYFDGQGYVIHNLYINRPEDHAVGLFARIGSVGVVLNVGLEGGSVTGKHYVGALAGANWSEALAACYASTAVSGNSRIGGLVGINRGVMDVCYATGPVTGERFVGGLVGRNYRGIIEESYAAGPVAGRASGGLTGQTVDGEVVVSFWDIDASGQSQSDGGWGVPTEEMMLPGTFLNAGWDFDGLWAMGPGTGRPYLR